MAYKEIPGPIEGYKIFNRDMTCRGFQFKIGINELGNDKPLSLCENGFHFCKYPSGVWAYYREGRVFKVRGYDVLDEPITPGADYKMCCRKIEILEEVLPVGHWNTGNLNTGDWNVGNRNTGRRNTGDWNAGDRHSGYFGIGVAPIMLFGKPVNDEQSIDWVLASRLGEALSSDAPFDPAPYLALPNATKAYIRRLHKAHIEWRKKASGK